MPTHIEKLADAPIVVVHATPGGDDVTREMVEAAAEINRVLDEQTEKVFLVMDMRNISMGLDDILHGAAISARERDAMLHHPNIRESIYVLTDGFIKMAVKGLNSATFGQVKAQLFDTVEEALDYCRRQSAPPEF